jgi:hypothetical protein
MRWAVFPGFLATWLGTIGPRAGAATPDEVLRAKGLTRVGSVYVLGEEDDLKDRIAVVRGIAAESDRGRARLAEEVTAQGRLERRYQDILQQQQTLEAEWQGQRGPQEKDPERPPPPGEPGSPPPPPPPGGPGPPPPRGNPKPRDPFGPRGRNESRRTGMPREEILRPYAKLQTERTALEIKIVQGRLTIDRLAAQLETAARTLERRRAETLGRYDELKARYAVLAAESDVTRALAAAGSPELVLGPRAEDASAVQSLANNLPAFRGTVPDHRAAIELKGMSRLNGLAGAAETLLQDLGGATGKLQALEHDVEFRGRMIEQTPRAENPAKADKLRTEQVQARQAMREAYARLATTREDYLRALAMLGARLEPASGPREDSSGDSPARREILSLALRDKAAAILAPEHVARRLQELKKTIRDDSVPLDRDRTILWVDATLNGKPGYALVVDPDAEEVRISARVAAETGVRPSDDADESLVLIPLEGGRTVQARRARLASVQVGPVSSTDVECLVLPAEYGEAPAILGGSFLKRFATRTDADAGTLVLTQLQLKAASRASKGAATTKAAGAPKASRTAPPPGRTP